MGGEKQVPALRDLGSGRVNDPASKKRRSPSAGKKKAPNTGEKNNEVFLQNI